jgi:hypothetical protein
MIAKSYLLTSENTRNSGPITENAYMSDSQENETLPMAREQDRPHNGEIGSLRRCSHIDGSWNRRTDFVFDNHKLISTSQLA